MRILSSLLEQLLFLLSCPVFSSAAAWRAAELLFGTLACGPRHPRPVLHRAAGQAGPRDIDGRPMPPSVSCLVASRKLLQNMAVQRVHDAGYRLLVRLSGVSGCSGAGVGPKTNAYGPRRRAAPAARVGFLAFLVLLVTAGFDGSSLVIERLRDSPLRAHVSVSASNERRCPGSAVEKPSGRNYGADYVTGNLGPSHDDLPQWRIPPSSGRACRGPSVHTAHGASRSFPKNSHDPRAATAAR